MGPKRRVRRRQFDRLLSLRRQLSKFQKELSSLGRKPSERSEQLRRTIEVLQIEIMELELDLNVAMASPELSGGEGSSSAVEEGEESGVYDDGLSSSELSGGEIPISDLSESGGEGPSAVVGEKESGVSDDEEDITRIPAEVSDDDDDDGLRTHHSSRQASDVDESESEVSECDHKSLLTEFSSLSDMEYPSEEEEEEVVDVMKEEEKLEAVAEEDIGVFAISSSVKAFLDPIYEPMEKLAEHCDEGKRFFDALITATATVLGALFDEDDYYECGFSDELREQLNELWITILDSTKESGEILPVLKLFADGEIDFEKYPLVGEHAVARMVEEYSFQDTFSRPFPRPYPGYPHRMKEIEYDIVPTVRLAWRRFQILVDEYKHYFSEILDESERSSVEVLLLDAADKIVRKALCEVEADVLSEFWFKWEIQSCKEDLPSLVKEILWLVAANRRSSFINGANKIARPYKKMLLAWHFCSSEDVDCLIRLAECCRRAEHARFISTEHFVWAFQESGYVLPHWMELKGDSNKFSRAHPPYHVYTTAIMLARYLESKCVEAEHLAYASIFGQHVEPKPKQLEAMAKHYKELCSKSFERVERTCPTYSFSDPS